MNHPPIITIFGMSTIPRKMGGANGIVIPTLHYCTVPSGTRLHDYHDCGKSPCSTEQSTISMAIFHSCVELPQVTSHKIPLDHHKHPIKPPFSIIIPKRYTYLSSWAYPSDGNHGRHLLLSALRTVTSLGADVLPRVAFFSDG